MNEALRLMQEEGFDNADIVFHPPMVSAFCRRSTSPNLQKEQSVRRFYDHGHFAGSRKCRHGLQLEAILPKYLPYQRVDGRGHRP